MLTGRKGHSKQFFCLVVWGFFVFSFFGVFFLIAWYKKEKRQSEIVTSIILVKLCGCVCARVCEKEVQAGDFRWRLGASSAAGVAGVVGRPGASTWCGLQPAGPGEEGKYPCCCSLRSPPTLTLTPPFEIKRKKKAKKK